MLHNRWLLGANSGRLISRRFHFDAHAGARAQSTWAVDTKEPTPQQLVSFLDKYVVGQNEAKKAVALAMRNRWRRRMLEGQMRQEAVPMNILMCGSTGTGKTEIARRLTDVGNTPFVKVVATKFTEVGVFGTDADTMVQDLARRAYEMAEKRAKDQASEKAKQAAHDIILRQLYHIEPDNAEKRQQMLQAGELDHHFVDVEVADEPTEADQGNPFDRSNSDFGSVLKGKVGKGVGGIAIPLFSTPKREPEKVQKRVRVREAVKILVQQEATKRVDRTKLKEEALRDTTERGVIFIDEIDKLASPSHSHSSLREKGEGVQKELLGLLEGMVVDTPLGPIDTSHILFIAAGAFQNSSVSDLLPELQGRLPIRVTLSPLTEADYVRILKETEYNVVEQTKALLAVEGVTLDFTEDGIAAIARLTEEMNTETENIGARRLRTIIAKITEDVSFEAHNLRGATVVVDGAFVSSKLASFKSNSNLMKFVL